MFCTNPKKPPPIYDIVADTIEVCGGSRKLMNRLGCSSSPDTHERFVTHHAMARRPVATWDKLSTTPFTIASVDNFDMLQNYSAVYCGDQQRSYHGIDVKNYRSNGFTLFRLSLILMKNDGDNLLISSWINHLL